MREGQIRIITDKKSKTIDIVFNNNTYDPYWIPFDRIDTPGKLLGWITHLLESKEWATKEVLRSLIQHAAKVGKYNEYNIKD